MSDGNSLAANASDAYRRGDIAGDPYKINDDSKKVIKRKTNALKCALVFLVLISFAIASLLGYFSYLSIEGARRTSFDHISDDIHDSIAESFIAFHHYLETVAGLYAFQCGALESWPFCSLPLSASESILQPLIRESRAKAIGMHPIVYADVLGEFEIQLKELLQGDNGYPAETGNWSFGFGIAAEAEGGGIYRATSGNYSFSSYDSFLLPGLAMTPITENFKSIAFDARSRPTISAAVDVLIDNFHKEITNQSVTTDFLPVVDTPTGPALGWLLHPIVLSLDKNYMVGVVVMMFEWLNTFSKPNGGKGCFLIVSKSSSRHIFSVDSAKELDISDELAFDDSRCVYMDSRVDEDTLPGFVISICATQKFFSGELVSPITGCAIAVSFVVLLMTIGSAYIYFTKKDIDYQYIIRYSNRAFVGYISHGLRVPLNAIFLSLKLLETDLRKVISENVVPFSNEGSSTETCCSEETKRIRMYTDVVSDMKESAINVSAFLSDIVDYNLVENNMLKISREPVRICSLLHNVVDSFSRTVQELDINLTLVFGTELYSPSLHDSFFISGDMIKLKNAFRTIISSCIKFTCRSGEIDVMGK